MKFRIKFQQQNHVVEVPDENGQAGCLAELKQKIREKLLISDFEVSLNGKDPLVGEAKSLKELDLVTGDRVHILGGEMPESSQVSSTPDNKMDGKPQIQTPSHGSCSESVSTSQLTSKAGVGGESEERTESPAPSTSGGTADIGEMHTEQDEEQTGVQMKTDPEVNRYLCAPMLVREASPGCVPEVLEELYRGTGVQGSAHEAVFVVLHLLMQETGFSLKDKPEGSGLPPRWRGRGLYSLQYSVHSDTRLGVVLKYVDLADVGKVYCSVEGSDIRHSCQVKVNDYVMEVTEDAHTTYKNLDKLSRLFKDKVSFPVLQSIHKDGVPSLLNLTAEVQLMVLSHLSAADLSHAARVCRHLHSLTGEPALWRKLYLRRFGKRAAANSLNQDWRQFYREKTEERARMRTHYLLMTQPAMPRVPHYSGPAPFPPTFPPGAIGGDFDRDPFSPGVPDVFGRGRGVLPHSLPRPRFDPMGPFPEQNFRPGRGGGLWEGGGSLRRLGGGGMGGFL